MDDNEPMAIELSLLGLNVVDNGLLRVINRLNQIIEQLAVIRSTRPNIAVTGASAAAGNSTNNMFSGVMNVRVINWPARAFMQNIIINPPRPRNQQPPSWQKRFETWIYSMRFSQNGVQPLIGRTLALFPKEIQFVVKALAVLAVTSAFAAEAIANFRRDMLASGGTASEAGQLRAIGAGLGIENMGELSRNLAHRLATDSLAAAEAARIGVHDMGNPFATDLDKAKNLSKIIDHIRSASISDAEARRFAINTGTEELLRIRDASTYYVESAKLMGHLSSQINDAVAQNYSADFQSAWGQLKMAFLDLANAIGQVLMPVFTYLMEGIALFVEGLAQWVKYIVNAFNNLWNFFFHRDAITEEDKARKEHTDAMKEHSRMLKEGVYGGGERTRGAIPAAWTGRDSNAKLNPATMGSFGL